MKFKYKIFLILGFCITLSLGSFFIISFMFDNMENMLHEKCQIESMVGSRVVSDLMEFMITKGVASEAEMFDTNYIEIPNTRPKKYNTKYDRQIENYIQKIQDEFLKDQDLDFAVMIDRNGYVPVHNSKYSEPITGNYQIDISKSRSKRIFSDNPAIKQALTYSGNTSSRFLYYRDTGETMWLVASPIIIRNNRWGFFLLGVSLQRIDIIKNQMYILTFSVMFVILSLSILAIIGILPRNYLAFNLPEKKIDE